MNEANVFNKNGKAFESKVIASSDIKKTVERSVDLIGGLEKAIPVEIKWL